MDRLKHNVKESMKQFAEKFHLEYYIDSPYCLSRRAKNNESPCMGCESHAMCTIALKLFNDEKTIAGLNLLVEEANDLIKELSHGQS